MGFPTRDKRSAFGESYVDTYPVNDPTREISAGIFNASYWDLAAICQTGLKAAIKAAVSGGVATVNFQGLAWDPNGLLTAITFTRLRAGQYTFAFASQYPDESGTNRATALSHGVALPCNAVPERGEHDGGNNVATLSDSGEAWTVNEFVGCHVHNLTDGSHGKVTANTATTITATLEDGTENLWDTGDDYIVVNGAIHGVVNMYSTYTGELLFFDDNHDLVDPAAFALMLW